MKLFATALLAGLAPSLPVQGDQRPQLHADAARALHSAEERGSVAADFGRVREKTHDARVVVNGSQIAYHWVTRAPGYAAQPMELTIDFRRGLSAMQRTYSTIPHDLYPDRNGVWNYNRFISGDPYSGDLRVLADALADLARQHQLPRVEVAVDFVQSLPYQDMSNYQRYAVETLIDGKGDCSETSILLAGILKAWRLPVVLLDFPGHVAVGITGDYSGTYWQQGSHRYFFCETTAYNAAVGWIPEGYRRESKIHTVSSL